MKKKKMQCPEKSAFVLICLGILWFLFALLPTRFVILCAGLVSLIETFVDSKTQFTSVTQNTHFYHLIIQIFFNRDNIFQLL